jgi:hypothetical protein
LRYSARALIGLAASVAVAAALAVGAGPANAAEPSAGNPQAVEPVAALVPLKFFAGEWNCAGTVYDAAGGQRPITIAASASYQLGGHWMGWTLKEQSAGQDSFEGQWVWGWDSAQSSFIAVSYDNSGSRSAEQAPGWAEDKFLWAGQTIASDGTSLPSRSSITKSGENELHLTSTLDVGQWFTVYELNCARAV